MARKPDDPLQRFLKLVQRVLEEFWEELRKDLLVASQRLQQADWRHAPEALMVMGIMIAAIMIAASLLPWLISVGRS